MLFFMTFTAEESKKFTTIFKQHYKKLVCKARTILFSYDLAEDAVEDALLEQPVMATASTAAVSARPRVRLILM